jgi:hypothetical protein
MQWKSRRRDRSQVHRVRFQLARIFVDLTYRHFAQGELVPWRGYGQDVPLESTGLI